MTFTVFKYYILKVQSKVNHKKIFHFGDVVPKYSKTCYRCHLKNEKHIERDSEKKSLAVFFILVIENTIVNFKFIGPFFYD